MYKKDLEECILDSISRGIYQGLNSINEKYGVVMEINSIAEEIYNGIQEKYNKGLFEDYESHVSPWIKKRIDGDHPLSYNGRIVVYERSMKDVGIDCKLLVCLFCDENLDNEGFYFYSQKRKMSFIGLNECSISTIVHELRHLIDHYKYDYGDIDGDYQGVKWKEDHKKIYRFLYLTSECEMNAFLQQFYYDFNRILRNYIKKEMPDYGLNHIELLGRILKDFSKMNFPNASFENFSSVCQEGSEDKNHLTMLTFLSYNELFKNSEDFYQFICSRCNYNKDVFKEVLKILFERIGFDFDKFEELVEKDRYDCFNAYRSSIYYDKLPKELYKKYRHYYNQWQKIISEAYTNIRDEEYYKNRIDYKKERESIEMENKMKKQFVYKVRHFLKDLFKKQYKIEVIIPEEE